MYSKPSREPLDGEIVRTIHEPLAVLSGDLRVLAVNPAFHRAFGLKAADVLGRRLTELGGMWRAPRLVELLDDLGRDGEAFEGLGLELGHVAGGTVDADDTRPRQLLLNGRRIVSAEPGEMRVLLAIQDVTDRTATDRALEHQARESARSNRDLEAFASIASHDLQEPLRKIRAFGGLLRETLGEEVSPVAEDYLDRMVNAAERMQRMVDDLLAYARIDRRAREFARVDLGAVARDVESDLDLPIRETGARVEIGPLFEVEGDRDLLRALILNLVGNAIKYHKPGAPPVVRVSREPGPPGHGILIVEDEGIGFEPRHADRIFQPFQRLHTRDAYPGSGIGLAISRRIVERHEGLILAQGRPGEGTRIVVQLPLPPTEETPHAA